MGQQMLVEVDALLPFEAQRAVQLATAKAIAAEIAKLGSKARAHIVKVTGVSDTAPYTKETAEEMENLRGELREIEAALANLPEDCKDKPASSLEATLKRMQSEKSRLQVLLKEYEDEAIGRVERLTQPPIFHQWHHSAQMAEAAVDLFSNAAAGNTDDGGGGNGGGSGGGAESHNLHKTCRKQLLDRRADLVLRKRELADQLIAIDTQIKREPPTPDSILSVFQARAVAHSRSIREAIVCSDGKTRTPKELFAELIRLLPAHDGVHQKIQRTVSLPGYDDYKITIALSFGPRACGALHYYTNYGDGHKRFDSFRPDGDPQFSSLNKPQATVFAGSLRRIFLMPREALLWVATNTCPQSADLRSVVAIVNDIF